MLGAYSLQAQISNDSIQQLPDIEMSDSISLQQTVVIGYGSVKKADLTSSVSTASAKEITQIASTTAMQSLQGKLSGVTIINSDSPGTSPTVVIRGMGTALGGKAPLYVVDGLVVPNIMNINPNDIEKIDVLKDAASSAIYGVRGGNGVVVITTKKGKTGKVKLSYDSYYGVRNTLNMVNMAGADEYTTYFNEQLKANNATQFLNPNQRYDTNWYNEAMKSGSMVSNNVAISGASKDVNYFFSINNFEENGILEGDKYKRTTVRNNNDFKLFDGILQIKESVSVAFSNASPKDYSVFNTMYRQAPIVPVKYEDGKWGQRFWNKTTGEVTYLTKPGEQSGELNSHGNPMTALYYDNQRNKTTTLQGSIDAILKITKGLTFTSRAGATKYWYKNTNFVSNKNTWLAFDPRRTSADFELQKKNNPTSVTWVNNSLEQNNIETFRWSWENFVTFDRKFGEHSFNLVAGISAEKKGIGSYSDLTVYDVRPESQYWSVDHSSGEYNPYIKQNNYTPKSLASYFGRLQYNFDSKYYLTAIIRRDGSSAFKENKKFWGTFPAFSAAWNISNEEFLKDSNVINFLKLRGGWGKLGNDEVRFNQTNIYTGPGSTNYNYVFGPGQDLIYGAYVGTPAKDISWEIVKEYTVGLDFDLFNYKLSGSIDFYKKTTDNAILDVKPLLNSAYSDNFFDHAAKIENKGYEISLVWKNTTPGGFSYSIGGNFNQNINKVLDVKDAYAGMTGGSLNNGQITKRLEAGQALGSFWLYEVDGVWQNQNEINTNPHLSSARPGHLRYKDQNGDGIINDLDKKFMGSYIPKFNYGINISMEYKNIDLNISGYGVGGNKVYNGIKNTRLGGENISMDMFNNRWTGEGSTNVNPGAERDQVASSYYLEKGDYFKLSNVTLGYNFRDQIDFVKNLRLYVSAQNLFMITKYSGFTPELNGSVKEGDPYSTTGVDFSAYPNLRTFLIGLNVEF